MVQVKLLLYFVVFNFLIELIFLRYMSALTRNSNHRQKWREQIKLRKQLVDWLTGWGNKFLVIIWPSFFKHRFFVIFYNFKTFVQCLLNLYGNSVALKFQIDWFCLSNISRIWFMSKYKFRKLPTLVLLIELNFLSKINAFLRNFYHLIHENV